MGGIDGDRDGGIFVCMDGCIGLGVWTRSYGDREGEMLIVYLEVGTC